MAKTDWGEIAVSAWQQPTLFMGTLTIESVDDDVAVALREMGPARRIAMMFQAEKFARNLLRAGARDRHPEWTEAEVEKEVARLWADGSD